NGALTLQGLARAAQQRPGVCARAIRSQGRSSGSACQLSQAWVRTCRRGGRGQAQRRPAARKCRSRGASGKVASLAGRIQGIPIRNRLTSRGPSLGPPAGHAVPTPRVLSARRGHMTDVTVPARKPARPFFSSGPCAKPPGYSPDKLASESLGRSHRAKIGKARLAYCIDLMREVLQLPETHRIGIVPGSDTGAFEMAMWTMLGARGVTALAWESFGEGWVTDVVKQLRIEATVMRADYGQLPDLDKVDWSDDVLFTWNGTTSGCACPTASGSPPTARACRSATRPAPCSPTTSRGTRSMSRPSPGRRCSAARARTAC